MPKLTSPLRNFRRYSHSQGTETKCNAVNVDPTEEQIQKTLDPLPELKLPFPPQINAEDFINTRTRKLPSKPPNAFFIYRKVYTKALITQNLRFKMTDVSPLVSSSWKLESDEVKTKYKEIARDVRQIYKEKKDSIKESKNSSDEAASKNGDSQTTKQQKTNSSSSSSSSDKKERTETEPPLTPEELLLTPDTPQEDGLPEQWVHPDFPNLNFFPLQNLLELESSNNNANRQHLQSDSFLGNLNTDSSLSYLDYSNFLHYPQISVDDQLSTEPWAHEWNFFPDINITNVTENQF